ncbi:Folylpolyglutamate synthase [Dermatophilus congolensis]|uniref:tetrahydrofolate synthase n=1 Tax=Dermatophilus congolensis TaxID=1863 RepID=A0A239VJS5_9MICO|nr:Mur ligase family protein [Dermatophilus congolensis]SNV22013.1 Folylpolyglutamate synthase [Dermatophilus congolensis]
MTRRSDDIEPSNDPTKASDAGTPLDPAYLDDFGDETSSEALELGALTKTITPSEAPTSNAMGERTGSRARRPAPEDPAVKERAREVDKNIIARNPEHIIEPTLDRIRHVMNLLGDPQQAMPTIHITGTNGKTTTARMIERLLRELGLRTGRFTSPHLHDIRERIVLSGEPISTQRFLDAYEDIVPFVEMADAASQEQGGPRLSFFEVLVAMAYAAFADAPVEAGVIEVGMGGTWDATNVINATVAVFGPISMDHERYLGSDIVEIAREKAGIIKAGSIVISAEQDPAVKEILTEAANAVDAPIIFMEENIGVVAREVAVGGQMVTLRGLAGIYPDIFIPLFGMHQAHNAAIALAAVEAFIGGGQEQLALEVVQAAFADVTSPGRAELVRRSPAVLVDGAHNPAAVASLVATLEDSFMFTHTVGLLAVLADKDAEAMLEQLQPIFDEIVISQTTSPRRRSAEELGALAVEIFGENRVRIEPHLPTALDTAVELADAAGMGAGVVATGSVFTAGEVRLLLGATDA